MSRKALFIFRRDFRVQDNTGLLAAAASGKPVVLLFIVDPTLLDRWEAANFRLAFVFQSLAVLEEEIASRGGQLLVRIGNPAEVLADVIASEDIESVFVNREYTPLGHRRDEQIDQVCRRCNASFQQFADALLNEPEVVEKGDGGFYTVFTPYHKKAATFKVEQPADDESIFFARLSEPATAPTSWREDPVVKSSLALNLAHIEPGRQGAQAILDRLGEHHDYDDMRDVPAADRTTRLSAHLRFGTCSPREVYWRLDETLGKHSPLARQLYWRDFYVQIAVNFPHVYGNAFRRHYDAVPWDHEPELLAKWQQGKTGFPIVDAGMRELVATGYMHNRVRMIVASFLTKNLHIDWREGEAFFARYLIDYDPAVNNGNWQWGASTGCDAQPYFRIFNPWRQQTRFDKDCVYIKRWVPELEPYDPALIHKLEKGGDFYLPRIADLKASATESKRRFKAASQG